MADSEEKSIESNESGTPETPESLSGADGSAATVDTPGLGSDVAGLGGDSGAPIADKQTVVESGEPPAPELPVAFGRYRVERLLGRGGFGAVYLGFDTELERQVAIKAPLLDTNSAKVARDFLSEAKRLAQLRHPGIVSVFDVGIDASGRCFIVSDYLKGDPLHKWLKEHRPTWQQSVSIIAAVADALAHAHAERTVHRDLKPANIIMTDDRSPVVVDFGLALSDSVSTESQKGMLSGTPGYMAPEQARGQGHRIDGRTDIYALGVILYRMLTGRMPFQSKMVAELLRQVVEDEAQPPRQLVRDLPEEVETICMKAMSKRFKSRYSNADDFARALRGVLSRPSAGSAPMHRPASNVLDSTMDVHAPLEANALHDTYELRESPLQAPVAKSTPQPTPTTQPHEHRSTVERSSLRSSRSAERRRVSVVQFGCDVYESEDILEKLDEDEQGELLVRFQNLCRAVVLDQRGYIVQTTDQGILGCFGFPVSLEDATHRAVRAGLHLQAEMEKFNDNLEKAQQIRLSSIVAIHSDYAVLEEKNEADSISLTGQVRTVASQVEMLAEPNTVVVTDATYRLVKGYFACESIGKRKLRGVGQVELYRVLAEQATQRIDAADVGGDLTPLVGRDREVGLLSERWEQATEGMGQIVLLIGDAGLGKSRLVHVLKEQVATESNSDLLSVIEWRTTQHHQSSSLYPAIDCLERILGFDHETSSEQRLEKLVHHLSDLGLDGDEEIGLFASLLSIPIDGVYPRLELSPQDEKQKTFALLLDWLVECAARQPILFVVEDLHWIDPSSLQFLETLVDEGLNDRILSVFTFRPEFETPWKSKAHQTSVALNRLTKRQVGELMRAKLGIPSIPDSIVEQLVQRTGGVPLFVEEFASMIAAGAEEVDSDGAEFSSSFSLTEIPDTLHDLLMARLDRMASNLELVQFASALGRDFTLAMIKAVSDLDDATLGSEMDRLVASNLLSQAGRGAKRRYSFRHALLQDAAYQSLVKRKRQQVHQRIATTLEDGFPEIVDKQPEVLAHHFTEAGEGDKAVGYWQAAGARSLTRFAHHEAIQQLTKGLELLQQLPESDERNEQEIQMHISLGVPLQSTLGYSAPEVEENYSRAHQLCKQMGLTVEAFPVLYGLFRYFMLQAKYEQALELGTQLVKLADQSRKPTDVVAANRALGSTLVYKGELELALPYLQKVISIESTPELREEVYAYDVVDPWIASRSYLSWAQWMLGYPDQAKALSDEALRTAESLGHPFSVTLAVSFAQWLHQFRRDVPVTRKAADRSLQLSEEQGSAFWIGWCKVLRGWAKSQSGEADQAIDEIRDGIVAWRKQGSELGSHYFYVLLAEACARANRLADGLAALDDAQAFADQTGEGYWVSEIHRVRGELFFAQCRDDQCRDNAADRDSTKRAEECFRTSLMLAQHHNAKSLELRAATSLAGLLQSHGDVDAARATLEPVYAWFTEGFDTADLVAAKRLLDNLK